MKSCQFTVLETKYVIESIISIQNSNVSKKKKAKSEVQFNYANTVY